MFYDCSYFEIVEYGDKYRPAFIQSYINTLAKVSVLSFLSVQWLGLYAFTQRGTGSLPGQGTKIPQTP